MASPSSNSDLVRASRDGDYFHYLWAARRCLPLLSPHSGLAAVTIEGPSAAETQAGSAIDDGEELIDVGEYYGSEDLSKATLVRYIQLKHSTHRASVEWTASGLEKTFRGFAERYRAIQKNLQTTSLENRLELWFLTNRPIGADVREAVADAALHRPPRHPRELTKLENFTGLSGVGLAAFCKLLRLEAEQPGYWDQRNILVQDVSGYLPDWDVDAPTQLKELVTRKALSENATNPTITKMDVLRALKTDESSLLPAPCRNEQLPNAVRREQDAELVNRIVTAGSAPIVVHADGGVGKSIFATRIALGLPKGSFSVLYDCFGNGQYRSASGYRHRHKQGLVQIANELAGAGLCHLLIPTPNADAPAYIKAFLYRLRQAVSSLKSANPDALLCIVVDAADNAQMAAEEIGETRSFIKDLLREQLPDDVRLVALSRTHRLFKLDLPPNALPLELKAFNQNETSIHLRQFFPNASEQDISEFHRLSSHNPRVQSLAMSRNKNLGEILRSLGPNPTTVEQAIGSLLDQSISKLRDEGGALEKPQIDRICAGLAALRPLIPISVLSSMSGIPAAAIRSFAFDIGRPLLVSGETIQFLDEPTETWFRDKFRPAAAELTAFIESLKPLASGSAYVASALPQLMLEAGHFSELVKLALSSEGLPDTSPLERRDVELQRLQFALKASLRGRHYKDAAKLALRTGGESAGDNRQRKLIQDNTDLAAAFLSADRIEEVVSRRSFGTGWLGSHHAYEAGLMSGRTELLGDARSRLRMAFEWVQNWSRLPDEERKQERMTDQDIAEMALSSFNIHGAASCARWLRKWTPRSLSYRAGRIAARRLTDHARYDDLDQLALAAGNDIYLLLAITVELRSLNINPPKAAIERTLRLIQSSHVKLEIEDSWRSNQNLIWSVTALVEASFAHQLSDSPSLAHILTRFLPSEPPRGLSSRFDDSRTAYLRAYCLRAALLNQSIQLLDLAHPELRKELEKDSKHHDSQEAREFKEIVGALLPWHELRARNFTAPLSKGELKQATDAANKRSMTAARIEYRDEWSTSNEVASLWCKILLESGSIGPDTLDDLTVWSSGLKRPLFTPTLQQLARIAALNTATHRQGLDFAAQAFAITKDMRESAESKASGYIDIARSIISISKGEAAAYFNEAVEVASKIGDENLDRWAAMLDLAERAAQPGRPATEAAYRLARSAELTYSYVDRDKHFDWGATVQSIAALCAPSSLAILSRWRDRAFGRSKRLLPIAVEFLLTRRAIDPIAAVALLGFRAEWDEPTLLENAIDACRGHAEKETIASFVFRYISLQKASEKTWRKIKEILSAHGLTFTHVDALITFEAHEESIREARSRDNQVSWATRTLDEERLGPDWNSIFSGADLSRSDHISKSYRRYRAGEPRYDQGAFFSEAFARVKVGSESEFIAALPDVADFDLYHLRGFFESLPQTWRASLAVKAALAAMLKTFCRRYCMGITKSRYFQVLPFKLACELAGLPERELFNVILAAIGDAPELVGPERLFTLVGILTSQLSEDEALEVLLFGLDLFEPSLEAKDGDGPWSSALAPPPDVNLSLAGYVWGALASPHSSIRWEGAHATRALCELGCGHVISGLVDLARGEKGGPFADANLYFYCLHARQWLLIGLARAAKDHPEALVTHTDFLVQAAIEAEPHVLVRSFAAQALLSLLASGHLRDNELAQKLKLVNVSPFERIASNRYKRAQPREVQQDVEKEFYFGMDMRQYWFEPLGNHFAKSAIDIEDDVFHVIKEEWQHPGSGSWKEDERQKRGLFRDGETYYRHGGSPRSHDINFYLSYHALMTVAGKLLASTPLHFDPDSYDETFSDWLGRHDLTRTDKRWLADRRDAAPLEWPDWKNEESAENWQSTITRADLDRALGLTNNKLNLWGQWTTVSGRRIETLQVRSALVNATRSVSLLRALQTSEAPDRHYLPNADDDVDRGQIDDGEFNLKGWIVNREHSEGLDGEDPWAGAIRSPPPAPAPFVIELMALTENTDLRVWSAGEEPAICARVWGYYREKDDEDQEEDSGVRIRADLDFVVSFLRKIDMDLIVKVGIDRRFRRSRHESFADDLGYIPDSTKFFLIRSDGSVASL
ncbi:AVAST type 3 anti-phage nuclease/ATPase Avs3a [Bradyrhizobium guangdongense]